MALETLKDDLSASERMYVSLASRRYTLVVERALDSVPIRKLKVLSSKLNIPLLRLLKFRLTSIPESSYVSPLYENFFSQMSTVEAEKALKEGWRYND